MIREAKAEKDIDFAFFAAELGYTRRQYEELTPRDKAFIRKAWEDRIVRETNTLHSVIYSAVLYTKPKKSGRLRKFKPFWKKNAPKATEEMKQEALQLEAREKEKGFAWINKILRGRAGRRRK